MKKWLIILAMVLLGALLLAPEISLAQEEDPTASVFAEGDPNDRTVIWLNTLFPELGDADDTKAPVNVLAKLMKVVSLTLISLGLMWAGASAVGKLLQSNFDGKTLAQARGQSMTMIRLLGAVTALFPLPSGFPLISYLIFTVAIWGVNLGNALWSKTVDALVQEGTAVVQPAPSDIEGLALGLFAAESCMATLNAIGRENGLVAASTGTPVELVVRRKIELPGGSVVSSAADASKRQFGLSYDGADDSGLGSGICGTFTARLPQTSSDVEALAPKPSYVVNHQMKHTELLADALSPIAIGFANTQLDSQQARDIVEDVRGSIDTLHDRVVDVVQMYRDAHNDFVSGFGREIESDVDGQAEKLGERMKENGWSSAGGWWLKVVQINNQTQQYIDTLPQLSGPIVDFKGNDFVALSALLGEDGSNRAVRSLAIMHRFQSKALLTDAEKKSEYLIRDLPQTTKQDEDSPDNGSSGTAEIIISKASDLIAKPIVQLMDQFKDEVGDDPISAVIGFGQNLIVHSYNSYTKMTNLVEGKGFEGSRSLAESAVGGISLLALVPLLIAGAFLAFAMPIQIFIHFSLAVLGWFIAAIEAILAGPIWALMHMRIQGHQMIPFQTKAGYKLVLSLFLRPAFMIIGFVVAIGVFYIAMSFVGEQFLIGMSNIYPNISQAGANLDEQQYKVFDLASLVVFIILFLSFAMAVVKLSTRLMTALPDEIMSRWVGVSSTSPLIDNAKNEVDHQANKSQGANPPGGSNSPQTGTSEAEKQHRQSAQQLAGGVAANRAPRS